MQNKNLDKFIRAAFHQNREINRKSGLAGDYVYTCNSLILERYREIPIRGQGASMIVTEIPGRNLVLRDCHFHRRCK